IRKLLDESAAARPALAGKLNGDSFSDFCDYNDLTAPVLEAILLNSYLWLPFEQILRIEIEPPKQLRDLLWAKAQVEMVNEMKVSVFLPALYESSHAHIDDQIKLGRKTDWKQISEDLFIPYGQRLFLVDGEEEAFFEVRTL